MENVRRISVAILTYKTQTGLIFCTPKARGAIRKVLDKLRRDRRLRSVISRGSELNLRHLSYLHPNATRAFLKGLAGLDRLAIPIEGIVVSKLPRIASLLLGSILKTFL